VNEKFKNMGVKPSNPFAQNDTTSNKPSEDLAKDNERPMEANELLKTRLNNLEEKVHGLENDVRELRDRNEGGEKRAASLELKKDKARELDTVEPKRCDDKKKCEGEMQRLKDELDAFKREARVRFEYICTESGLRKMQEFLDRD
jgi:predicted  nucleic acid-binding Zn-ribbon protein